MDRDRGERGTTGRTTALRCCFWGRSVEHAYDFLKKEGGGLGKMPYDPEIHHRRSVRLKGYDYSQQGMYFVTVCVYGRIPAFGEVLEGEMCLNENGSRTQEVWLGLPARFATVELDIWMVMPDHIHGIIVINDANFQQQRAALGEIVRTYKAVPTRMNRYAGTSEFAWQRNYNERIIRIFNQHELDNIRQYIIDNPLRWHQKQQRSEQHAPVGATFMTPCLLLTFVAFGSTSARSITPLRGD